MTTRYDLIAIGGGTAGLVTAAGAAALGLRVALVERAALGGDCLWTGCVPSKALIASGRLAYRMRHAERLGLMAAAPEHAFGSVMERLRAAQRRVAAHDDPDRFRRLGVEVVFGAARLAGPRRISVDGRELEAKRIVIATGATPVVPPIPGLEQAGYLTYATAFEQAALPDRIVVVGGGPIGLEFAQVFSRLGTNVTVVEVLPQLLAREEPEAAELIQRSLESEGVCVRTGVAIERVECGASGRVRLVLDASPAGERAIETDRLFVATGRAPNTAGLDLQAAGIEQDGRAVRVDRTLRTTARGIWAAGDVAGGPQFTHVADYHAKLVLRNAVFPLSQRVSYRAVPMVTYTDPEVARVGLTETEARERFGRAEVYGYQFDDLDRAIVDGEATGFVKLIARPGGKMVGASVVASGAGELIVPLTLALQCRLRVGALARFVYPYPTMAEGIKRAADQYYRDKLAGRSGAWLRRIVRWLA